LLTVLMLISVWLATVFRITEPIYFPYMVVNTFVNMRVSVRLVPVITDLLIAYLQDEDPPK